jgi:hypothetical protein
MSHACRAWRKILRSRTIVWLPDFVRGTLPQQEHKAPALDAYQLLALISR